MRKTPGITIIHGAALAVLVVSALLFDSCSSPKYHYQDGYFSTEAADYDAYGWKEYVTVYVSSGQILFVEFNAFNKAGFIMSWDIDNMRDMNTSEGTYPNAYTRYYGEKLLSNQGIQDIDVLSGATHSFLTFSQLAEAVLDNAQLGEASTRIVTLEISNPYYREKAEY